MALIEECPIFLSILENLHFPEEQICYMPSELMIKISANIGDYIKIELNSEIGTGLICKVFPMTCSSCVCGYQMLAFANVMHKIHHIKDFHCPEEVQLRLKDISVLSCSEITSLKISIVTKSVENVMNAKKNCYAFESHLRYLLTFYKFVDKSVIKSVTNSLAKLLGILFIIINEVSMIDSISVRKNLVGQVTDSTVIVVDTIESQERHMYLIEKKISLGGLDPVIEDLKSLVSDPWVFREEFKKAGFKYPTGVLLIGPPGCGKSSLVQQICFETQTCLIATAGAELLSPYQGETLVNLSKVAKRAFSLSKEGPCVLFIDEIDSICPPRTKESTVQDIHLTSQVLVLLDEGKNYPYLRIMAATNRPYALNCAVRRSGRLEIEVLLNAPTLEERKGILAIHGGDLLADSHSLLEDVALATPGFVGADLQLLCNKVRENFTQREAIDPSEVCREMLRVSETITPSINKTLDFITTKPRPLPVGGLESVKAKLLLLLSRDAKYAEFYRKFKTKRPRGILLYGPRGCGKTRLVSLLASQKGFTFFSANASHLLSPYVGESEKRIAALFHSARLAQPSIIFIDEIDGIFGSRSTSGGGVGVNLLTELLQAMDGADVLSSSIQGSRKMKKGSQEMADEIVVCAATNHPQRLDSALLRPGRFDHVIYVPPPDRQARIDILKLKTKKIQLEERLLEKIADESEGWSGAELENLISQAAMQSVLNFEESEIEKIDISEEILMDIFKKTTTSLDRSQLKRYEDFEMQYMNRLLIS